MFRARFRHNFYHRIVALSRISTRRKNVEAENFRQSDWPIELSPRKKCRAVNSRNTFYFSRLDIFPPSGDPTLEADTQ